MAALDCDQQTSTSTGKIAHLQWHQWHVFLAEKTLFAWAWHVFIPNFPTKHPRKLMDMATKGYPVLAIISCWWLGGLKMWPQKCLSKKEPSPQVQEHLLCWFCRGDHLSEVTLPYLAAWLVGWFPCWLGWLCFRCFPPCFLDSFGPFFSPFLSFPFIATFHSWSLFFTEICSSPPTHTCLMRQKTACCNLICLMCQPKRMPQTPVVVPKSVYCRVYSKVHR